ncbi:hypothetical protein PAHAL_9G638800 [Panicum hallii]|uniref:Uncharacterized protein n=1 Tax=Panicum hallii TaxID=206008 RepID=A0A2T8I6T5_9POAL|nr:hypothetical protein PAHAL_9G638800 [Panicum hallii]
MAELVRVLAASPSAVISPCLRPLHVRFAWARSRHVIVDCNAGDGGGAAAARHGREIEEAGLTESERESAAPASRAPTVVVLSHHEGGMLQKFLRGLFSLWSWDHVFPKYKSEIISRKVCQMMKSYTVSHSDAFN